MKIKRQSPHCLRSSLCQWPAASLDSRVRILSGQPYTSLARSVSPWPFLSTPTRIPQRSLSSAYSASLGWEEGEHHWNLCHPQHILPPGVRLGDGRRRLSSVFKQVAMAAGLRAQILFWSFHGRAKMRGRMPRPARIVPKGDVESRRTLFDIYDPCLSIALRNTCTQ
jgi:hypothetical protein